MLGVLLLDFFVFKLRTDCPNEPKADPLIVLCLPCAEDISVLHVSQLRECHLPQKGRVLGAVPEVEGPQKQKVQSRPLPLTIFLGVAHYLLTQ